MAVGENVTSESSDSDLPATILPGGSQKYFMDALLLDESRPLTTAGLAEGSLDGEEGSSTTSRRTEAEIRDFITLFSVRFRTESEDI